MAKPDDTDRMLAELVKGKRPAELLGEEGVLEQLTKRWKRPIEDWTAALNHFTIVFEGRIPN